MYTHGTYYGHSAIIVGSHQEKFFYAASWRILGNVEWAAQARLWLIELILDKISIRRSSFWTVRTLYIFCTVGICFMI